MTLNKLTNQTVVFVGQKLIIKPAGSVSTATSEPTETVTPRSRPPTASPSATISTDEEVATVAAQLQATQSQMAIEPDPTESQGFSESKLDPVLLIALSLLAIGVLLMLSGKLLQRLR